MIKYNKFQIDYPTNSKTLHAMSYLSRLFLYVNIFTVC